MTRFLHSIFAVTVLFALAPSGRAQTTTTWTNGADDADWSNPANWDNGVPTSTSLVHIGTQSAAPDNVIGVVGGAVTVASFTFDQSLNGPVIIVNTGAFDTLTDTGSIVNNDESLQSFQLPFLVGGNATYSGNSGGLSFTSLNVGSFDIATTGSVSITSGLIFQIDSIGSYGSIGLVSTTGASITINLGSYTGHYGDTFDFTTGSFTGASLNSLPTLTGGLTWDSSQFITQGVLTVVPEPSAWGLLSASLAILLIFRHRNLVPLRQSAFAIARRKF